MKTTKLSFFITSLQLIFDRVVNEVPGKASREFSISLDEIEIVERTKDTTRLFDFLCIDISSCATLDLRIYESGQLAEHYEMILPAHPDFDADLFALAERCQQLEAENMKLEKENKRLKSEKVCQEVRADIYWQRILQLKEDHEKIHRHYEAFIQAANRRRERILHLMTLLGEFLNTIKK